MNDELRLTNVEEVINLQQQGFQWPFSLFLPRLEYPRQVLQTSW